jgi:hypothetical protein
MHFGISDVDGTPNRLIPILTSFYFMVVTISTVGYGDQFPTSDGSRVVIMILILSFLAIVPVLLNGINESMVRIHFSNFSCRKSKSLDKAHTKRENSILLWS